MTLPTITLSRALAECLEGIQEHDESLEDCLRRFPQHREELRVLLEVALALQASRKETRPSPSFVVRLKKRLIKEAKSIEGR